MALIEIWLPLLGDGTEGNPYRPDIPAGMPYASDEAAPTDLLSHDGRPFTSTYNAMVDEKDAARCKKQIPLANVPEKDRLAVQMIRSCRDGYEAKAPAFFATIADISIGTIERKQMAIDLLDQAGARGLSAVKKLEIAESLELTAVPIRLTR